jgi:iron complex transport system permease protein
MDEGNIVWGSRVPRTVLGLMVGVCLGVAGAVMQGQTRNPLADPGIFGVSAGAGLAVVIGMYAFGVHTPGVLSAFAVVGALVATLVVFTLTTLGDGPAGPVPMAIAGMAVSAFCSAFTSFMVLTDQESLSGYRIWVIGSLSGVSLTGTWPIVVMAVVGLILALFNVRSLNLLALGTDLAKGLGQGILKARIVGLSAITLLTAAAVSLTGPIGFVGLTAPHLARALVGADHRRLVPVSGILGAAVLLLADVVGRLLGGQSETQVGVVLSVIGGIAFILIVRRSRQVSL